MLTTESLNYILSFLIRQELPPNTIGYTSDITQYDRYKIIIRPSHFFDIGVFGSPQSVPQLPLLKLNGIPILYGTNEIEKADNTFVVHADLIASSFFLLSRYEETINPIRDIHGRFPGKESIPFKAGFIHRPIVDEYGKWLRQLLRQCDVNIPEPAETFSDIYLTHDVDILSRYRYVRGTLGGLKRILLYRSDERFADIWESWRNIQNDPAYTFPWLFKQDEIVANTHKICFVKAGHSSNHFDNPQYDLYGHDAQLFRQFCLQHHVDIKLHASYASGTKPELIKTEKANLEKAFNLSVTGSRHHYLRTCEPKDMQALIDAEIKDDYTLGYADMAGFRLGTCHAVQWINPHTTALTTLQLHPLTMMDCSLSDNKYMGMDFDDAWEYCQDLIKQVKTNGGELVLLWHNTSVSEVPEYNCMYHRELYKEIISSITK